MAGMALQGQYNVVDYIYLYRSYFLNLEIFNEMLIVSMFPPQNRSKIVYHSMPKYLDVTAQMFSWVSRATIPHF